MFTLLSKQELEKLSYEDLLQYVLALSIAIEEREGE